MDFSPVLVNALLADYYFISFQVGRGQNLDLFASIPLAENYGKLFTQMDVEFSAFQYTEDPQRYMWLTFNDEQTKDQVENYFTNFNVNVRAAAMIIRPDIYEGERAPNVDVAGRYLAEIERFFAVGSDGLIRIPCGLSDSMQPEREYMVYSEQGMMGLHPESRLFRRS